MAPTQPPTRLPVDYMGCSTGLRGCLVFAQRFQVEDPDFWTSGPGGRRMRRIPLASFLLEMNFPMAGPKAYRFASGG